MTSRTEDGSKLCYSFCRSLLLFFFMDLNKLLRKLTDTRSVLRQQNEAGLWPNVDDCLKLYGQWSVLCGSIRIYFALATLVGVYIALSIVCSAFPFLQTDRKGVVYNTYTQFKVSFWKISMQIDDREIIWFTQRRKLSLISVQFGQKNPTYQYMVPT